MTLRELLEAEMFLLRLAGAFLVAWVWAGLCYHPRKWRGVDTWR